MKEKKGGGWRSGMIMCGILFGGLLTGLVVFMFVRSRTQPYLLMPEIPVGDALVISFFSFLSFLFSHISFFQRLYLAENLQQSSPPSNRIW
jgi:hypothetical protein